ELRFIDHVRRAAAWAPFLLLHPPCRFLIDWLKTQAPFWKLEDTDQGAKWVDADAKDDAAAARWVEK
ncbi:MAG TPA: hypothetical protein VHM01_15295, partial [Alphaproteobacteria bacterium]|nr:hypothetical protein [Alphaproteobacteria bacterium]